MLRLVVDLDGRAAARVTAYSVALWACRVHTPTFAIRTTTTIRAGVTQHGSARAGWAPGDADSGSDETVAWIATHTGKGNPSYSDLAC